MDLYLVRHAAAADDPARWPVDRDRPLTEAGEKKFRRAARGLGQLVPSVEVVLSSPFRRAWQTAEILMDDAGWPRPRESQALESGRAPTEILQALLEFAGATSVALVGHEPTMHELASYLVTADTGHARLEFRKGSVACLELTGELRPGSATLRWLLAPKALRAIA